MQIKIALSTVPGPIAQYSFFPNIALLYLASYARKYSCKEIAFKYFESNLTIEKYLSKLQSFSPDIIAFSVSHYSFDLFRRLLPRIKRVLPNSKIIAGGNYPSLAPEEFLKAGADIVVIGEGEKTFSELIDSFMLPKGIFQGLDNIDGIAYLSRGKEKNTNARELIKDLDTIPFPAWELINLNEYIGYFYQKRSPEMFIVSYRGCPQSCIFCSNPVWRNQKLKFRLRSPNLIAQEIKFLYDNYGIKEIYDYSDYFNVNLTWAKEVCTHIKKLNLKNFSFKCLLRVDNLDREFVGLLKEIGTWFVHFGIESANDATLKGVKKGFEVKQVEEACRLIKEFNIKIGGFFMIFNIWEENNKLCYESVSDCKKTLKYANYLLKKRYIDYMSWGFAVPMPGSGTYTIAKKYGLIKNSESTSFNPEEMILNLPGITKDDLSKIKAYGMMLQSYYSIRNLNVNWRHFFYFIRKLRVLGRSLMRSFNQ